MALEELTDEALEDFEEYDDDDLTDSEREAREGTRVILDRVTQDNVNILIDKLMKVTDIISGHPLRRYQKPFARRIFESLIIDDGAKITALFARQTGKSETVANVMATSMIMLPLLARAYPDMLGKFREGVWVGAFAPVDEQADTLFGRIVSRLASDSAQSVMADPEVNAKLDGKGRTVYVKFLSSDAPLQDGKGHSFVRKTTAHPRATIEGRSYHIILIDECFPAGTPVLTIEGWVDIKEIVDNPDKEWIVATQGTDSSVEWSKVTAGYKTRRHNELVRVVHEHGSIYATANHPFMVGGERVPAAHLRPGTPLSVVQAASEPVRGPAKEVPSFNCGSMLQFSSGTTQEPVTRREYKSENLPDSSGNGASPYSPWGQRFWFDSSTADASTLSRAGMAPRACSPNWRKDQGRTSDELQDRPGEPRTDDSRRDRRGFSRNTVKAGSRQAEGIVVVESRVVSVEILEPGSLEFSNFSDGADYVYTLEVAHPSHTYTAAGVLVGNCQGADDRVVNKSIGPMGAAYNATMVMTGTPTYTKNVFYSVIGDNKRDLTRRGHHRCNHFEVDWREAALENAYYKKFVEGEMLRLGEDSDEFRLSYRLMWLLDKGMFTTSAKLDDCGDVSMQQLVKQWHHTPVVVGIDCARKQDRTVVTVVYVDWDHPDELGMYHHRVLNWLDLEGMDWEEQYFQIVEFLQNYNVWKIGVDVGGVGDVVASRLKTLMPQVELVEIESSQSSQSTRWKYLRNLIDRRQVMWPSGSKVRKLKVWRRFRQEMEDLEILFKGPYVLAEAPSMRDAHDDYADSLALACILTRDYGDEEVGTVEVMVNPFYTRNRRRYEGR